MDSNQVSPSAVDAPPKPDSPKRRSAALITGVLLLLVLLSAGGGLFAFQEFSVNPTATAVVLGNTATAENKATNTQAAKVTGTANAHSTATGVAVATRTARAEYKATAAANMTATATVLLSSAPVPSSWRVVGYDTFESNGLGWSEYPTHTFDEGAYSSEIEGGILFIEAETTKPFIFYNQPQRIPLLSDFYVSVDVNMESSGRSSNYGLYLRYDSITEDLYGVIFNNNGRYFIVRYQNGYETILLDSRWPSIDRTGANTIGARFVGDQLTIYMNGTELASVKDDKLKKGRIKLFMVQHEYGGTARMEIDNFQVLAP